MKAARSRSPSRRSHCPNCDAEVDDLDWICAYCDHILDPSVLEGSNDEEPSAWSSQGPMLSESPPDAMILGDVDVDPDGFRVVPGAGASGDGRTTTLLFYTSTATTRVVRPDAVPLLVPVSKRAKVPTTPYEDFLLSCIDGRLTIRQIQKDSGLTPQEVTITLLTLMDKGLVRFEGADDVAPNRNLKQRADSAAPRRPRSRAKSRTKSKSRAAEDESTIAIDLKRPRKPSPKPALPVTPPALPSPPPALPPPLPKRRSLTTEPPRVEQGAAIPELEEDDNTVTQALLVPAKIRAALEASDSARADRPAPAPPPLPSKSKIIPPPLPKVPAPSIRARALTPTNSRNLEPPSRGSVWDTPSAQDRPIRTTREIPRIEPRPPDRPTRPIDPPEREPSEVEDEPPTGEAEIPRRRSDLEVTAPPDIESVEDEAPFRAISASLSIDVSDSFIESYQAAEEAANEARNHADEADEADEEPDELLEPQRRTPAATSEHESSTELHELELPSIPPRGDSGFEIVLSQPPIALMPPVEPPPVQLPISALIPLPPEVLDQVEQSETQDLEDPDEDSPEAEAEAPDGMPAIDGLLRDFEPEPVKPKVEPEPRQAPPRAASNRRRHGSVDPARMSKAAKLYEAALEEKAAGNLVSAKMNFKLAMTFDPTNALYKQAFEAISGSIHNAGERNTKARSLYDRATQAERLGQVEEAIDLLEQALEESRDAAVLNRLGVLLAMKRQEHKRARELIQEAIKLSPGNQVYENNLKKVLARAAARVEAERREAAKKKGFLGGLLGRKK